MKRKYVGVCIVLLAAVVGIGLWVQAGEVQPPSGPVGPTMKTLADLSNEHAAIHAALSGGGSASVKRILRGVITFPAANESEQTQALSAEVDPEKCVVQLGPVVVVNVPTSSTSPLQARNGACLLSLTPTEISVAVDQQNNLNRRVSYQIIEYH